MCTHCQKVNFQNSCPWSSRFAIASFWFPEFSNRNILLLSDNQNGFLITIFCIKRDSEVRKCPGSASEPEECRLLESVLKCGDRTLRRTSECRTEFVLYLCETPRTKLSPIVLLCFVYLVTCPKVSSKLKCRTFSDVEASWCSSEHAVALLDSNNAAVFVGLEGFLLVVQFEAAILDPSNFSLFSFRPPAMDLTTAYRYNQNMMEYYTCKSKSLS